MPSKSLAVVVAKRELSQGLRAKDSHVAHEVALANAYYQLRFSFQVDMAVSNLNFTDE